MLTGGCCVPAGGGVLWVGPQPIAKAPLDPLSPRGFDRIVAILARELRLGTAKATAKDMLRILTGLNIDWSKATDAKLDALEKRVSASMIAAGLKAARFVGPHLADKGPPIGQRVRTRQLKKHELGIRALMTVVDRRAIARVGRDQANFVRDFYTKQLDPAISKVARDTVTQGLEEGLGTNDIAVNLRRGIRGKVKVQSEAYYAVVSSSYTNRARSFSSLRAFQDADITRFVIVAVQDERTTQICFAQGTLVKTPDGEVAIESVRPGDRVRTGFGDVRPVRGVAATRTTEWVVLSTLSGRRVTATPCHPMLTIGGWVEAGRLRNGARLVPANSVAKLLPLRAALDDECEGAVAAVQGGASFRSVSEPIFGVSSDAIDPVVSAVRLSTIGTAYNLEIEGDDPTYVAAGLVVHNCRWLDGQLYDVQGSLDILQSVQELEDPTDVKFEQPWMVEKKIASGPNEGRLGLWVPQRGRPSRLAAVVQRPGVGRDDSGQITGRLGPNQMQKLGVGPPPYHGLCRSTIEPE